MESLHIYRQALALLLHPPPASVMVSEDLRTGFHTHEGSCIAYLECCLRFVEVDPTYTEAEDLQGQVNVTSPMAIPVQQVYADE